MTRTKGSRGHKFTPDQLTEVRRLLTLHTEPEEIARLLGMSRTTVFRRIKTIKEEDEKEMQRLRAEGFAHDLRFALLSYEEQIRQLKKIRDGARSDYAKIEATNSIVDIETLMLNVKGMIPKLFEEQALQKRATRLEADATTSGSSDSGGPSSEAGDMGSGEQGDDDPQEPESDDERGSSTDNRADEDRGRKVPRGDRSPASSSDGETDPSL